MTDSCCFRSHPIYILHFLRKYLFILLIPLGRGFVHALTGGFASWIQGAWMDILAVLLFFLTSFLLWLACRIQVSPSAITVKQGFLFRRTIFIPASRFSCVTSISAFYLKPFHAMQVRIDTPGGRIRKADLVLTISQKNWEKFYPFLHADASSKEQYRVYSPKNSYIVLLAALTSNSFAGILVISTFITQLGSILGSSFSERIYNAFESTTRLLSVGIPPIAVALAVLLIVGWLLTFFVNAIRQQKLTVRRTNSLLEISGGLFTQRTYFLSPRHLAFIDIRQTLLTRILKISSVFVYTIGYRKYDAELDAVIPCANPQNLRARIFHLLPEYFISERQVKPRIRHFIPPMTAPVVGLCLLIPIAARTAVYLLPDWAPIIWWGTLFCEVPAIWYALVRIVDGFTAGISLNDECWTLRYTNKFHFHTVLIRNSKVSGMILFRTPWQKIRDRCHLIVFSYTERRNIHVIRNLPYEETLELIKKAKNSK